jgi:hypothetical protein
MIGLVRPNGSQLYIRADAVVAIAPPQPGAAGGVRATILLSTGVQWDVIEPPETVLAEMKRVSGNA